MARRNQVREQALAEAKRRERAAGKKVSRIEAHGTNVAKSQFDPRVGAKALEAMSTRELRRHTAALNRFTDRGTQFVSGFAGSAIPRDLWEQYKRLEARNNARADAVLNAVGNVKLPGQDLTIAGRLSMTTPTQGANNQGRVYQRIERQAQFINGLEGLQALIESMQQKVRGDYLQRTTRKRLNSGEAILRYSGNEDLIGDVENLTLEQRQILVDFSTFFDIALEQFDSPDKSEVSQVQDAYYEEHEGVAKNIHVREALLEQLNWVKEIAPRGKRNAAVDNTPVAKPGRRRSRRDPDTPGPRR